LSVASVLLAALRPAAALADGPARLIFFGHCNPDWKAALGPASPVWVDFPGIAEIAMASNWPRLLQLPRRPGLTDVIVPLYENDLVWAPRVGPRLRPSRKAAAILGDKRRFAEYVAALGLGRYCPPTFLDGVPTTYPCVAKPRHGMNGGGCSIVASPAEADRLRRRWPAPVMQALVPGASDYVTHAIARGGRLLWHCSYRYEIGDRSPIRSSDNHKRIDRVSTPAVVLEALEALLQPLAYDGPLNADYKLDADGAVSLFEINPRFGGSLMRPQYLPDLRAALQCLLANLQSGRRAAPSHASLPGSRPFRRGTTPG